MINDVDDSIRALLEAEIVRGANIDIAFDLPNQEWASKRQGPALNVYLYDVREDLERRQVQFEPQYDAGGMVTARTTPPRRFKLAYLVTAWAQRPQDEHRLLSAVLDTFVATDEFPAQHLQGRVAGVGPIKVTIALPLPPGRSLSDTWSALGGGLRPTLDLVVTVPLGARTDPHVGPPVLEGPTIAVIGPDGTPVAPMGRFARPASDEPDAVRPPAASASEPAEVVDAARFRLGRRVQELGEDDLLPGRRIGISAIPRTEPDR